MARRPALTSERVVRAAVQVADSGGLDAVSMRNVGKELGVEAMSLYHHVANKDALLDALADWVFAQIELPDNQAPWRAGLVARSISARDVLVAHPWGLGMLESRPAPGGSLLRHHEAVLGLLFNAGFSAALATHAFSAVDAYVYGFALTQSSLPFEAGDGAEEAFALEVAPSPEEYPNLTRSLAELMSGHDYAFADEFAFGLDLILDSVERLLERSTRS